MTTTNSETGLRVTTPGDRRLVTARRFNAPVALVWRCYTEPALVQRWMLGPPGWTMPVCEIDLRVGGKYRYCWRSEEDGTEFTFVGEFLEIEKERRIVHTEQMEGAPEMPPADHEAVFSPLGDMTELVMTITYANAEIRRKVLETGMTDGMASSFNRLDDVLAAEGA